MTLKPAVRYLTAALILFAGAAATLSTALAEERFLDRVFTQVNVQSGVQFGAGVREGEAPEPLLMDVYSPRGDGQSNRPVIVLAFPGGFTDGARDNPEMVFLATQFAQRGYVAASIDYRLIESRPRNTGDLQISVLMAVHDMRAAVRFFREDAATDNRFGTDGETILVGGISAGAVVAAVTSVLDEGDRLPEEVLEYLAANGGMAGNSSDNTEFSSAVSGVFQISGAIRRLSWIEPGDAPIYAAHEELDPVVPCGTLPGVAFVGFGLALTSSGACDMIPAARAVGVPTEFFLDRNAVSHIGYSNSELEEIFNDSAAFFFREVLQPRKLASAVLPVSRSVQVGDRATVFASVINTSPAELTGCSVTPLTRVPADFSYQITDANNALLASPNTPFAIAASASQSLLLTFKPDDDFDPVDVFLQFECDERVSAASNLGLNSVLLSADNAPVADVIGLTTVVNLPAETDTTSLFAVGSANVGAAGEITVTVDDGGAGLPVELGLCETAAETGACKNAASESVTLTYDELSTRSFAIFVTPRGPVDPDPAKNRLFVRFTDAGGMPRGATSTAIFTPPVN